MKRIILLITILMVSLMSVSQSLNCLNPSKKNLILKVQANYPYNEKGISFESFLNANNSIGLSFLHKNNVNSFLTNYYVSTSSLDSTLYLGESIENITSIANSYSFNWNYYLSKKNKLYNRKGEGLFVGVYIKYRNSVSFSEAYNYSRKSDRKTLSLGSGFGYQTLIKDRLALSTFLMFGYGVQAYSYKLVYKDRDKDVEDVFFEPIKISPNFSSYIGFSIGLKV